MPSLLPVLFFLVLLFLALVFVLAFLLLAALHRGTAAGRTDGRQSALNWLNPNTHLINVAQALFHYTLSDYAANGVMGN